jgi:hypothetical protein
VQGKRKRVMFNHPVDKPPKNKVKGKNQRPRFGLKKGDAVSVSPKIFDGDKPGSFSKDNPERQLGTIVRVWEDRKLPQVEWIDGSKNLYRYDQLKIEKLKVDAAFMVRTLMMVKRDQRTRSTKMDGRATSFMPWSRQTGESG